VVRDPRAVQKHYWCIGNVGKGESLLPASGNRLLRLLDQLAMRTLPSSSLVPTDSHRFPRFKARGDNTATLMVGLTLAAIAGLGACLTSVAPLAPPGYHNPLDFRDGGADSGLRSPTGDGGASSSQGQVQDRRPDLTSAVYFVDIPDGGAPTTTLVLGDVAALCGALQSDGGGLGDSWDLVRLRLAGDVPNTYPVAAALGPSGAVAGFQFHSDGGGFGTLDATGGSIALDAVDPENHQAALGSYALTFSETESLSGRFSAEPCASLAPPTGG
jgi:hypothetical protein